MRTRRHHDFCIAGVAALVVLDRAGQCKHARLVYLSVGDGPVEGHQAVRTLLGQKPTPDAIRAAAHTAASDDVDPSNDIHASAEFRRHLVEVLTRRADGALLAVFSNKWRMETIRRKFEDLVLESLPAGSER